MTDALKKLFLVIVLTIGLMISMILTIIGAVCYCIDQLGEMIIGVAYKLIDAMNKKANEVFLTEGEDSVESTDSEEK